MDRVLITCEHSSNKIPKAYRGLFKDHAEVLDTHRAWDYGAKQIANFLARSLDTEAIHGEHSRLLIDLNRSSDNINLFSPWTKNLDPSEKDFLRKAFHAPHWAAVETNLKKLFGAKRSVLHIGVHSFTPVYEGKKRSTDIGILFDPSRQSEVRLARTWQRELKKTSAYTVHLNRPYRGSGDGLITSLRGKYSDVRYVGIELEVNHRCMEEKKEIAEIARLLKNALTAALK